MCSIWAPLLNHVSRHRFLIGYVMGHMWVSPRWRIIYICPWACLTLFWCFWFCLFWFQEELIESSSDDEESGPQDEEKSASVVDVEDLGNIMNSVKKAKVRFWYEWLLLVILHQSKVWSLCTLTFFPTLNFHFTTIQRQKSNFLLNYFYLTTLATCSFAVLA